MNNNLMFSKASDEWETPQWLYDKLDSVFHFTLDPCASHENHKCDKYYTIEENGLLQDWTDEVAFINPPYSQTKSWALKCTEENTSVKVFLVPSRTDTVYSQSYIFPFSSIVCFVRGRLKFGDQKNSAPFPSMIAVFGEINEFQKAVLDELGFCMQSCLR